VNHYCTYFDRGFLPQGLALWGSLRRHDAGAVLWVLALDDATAGVLQGLADPALRPVALADLERDDPALAVAKGNRSKVEYYFTLSPCWPLWLLQRQPEIGAVTYLDADLFFFASPRDWFAGIEASGASVAITAHRYPPELRVLEKWGRYNVGIQYFKRDERGLAVLADWRQRCLAWCYDRLEPDRFADQKYLETWPERFGPAVHIVAHPGINAAPWNWSGGRWSLTQAGLNVDGHALVVFHFAKLRPLGGGVWDSGQLEFAVMPRWLRARIYGPYVQALEEAARRLNGAAGDRVRRGVRPGLKKWLMHLAFGSLWARSGGAWLAVGLGPLGRYSGRLIHRARRRALS
jgi:hypothetical protein